ncbi:MAG: IS701 family transposase, partial [Planctomycetota bacterium]
HQRPLVSRLRPDAALYAPAPARRAKQTGRPRRKGRKIDSPGKAAKRKNAAWKKTTVDWYGGGTRRVRLLTGTAVWYNRGRAVPIRWVYVVDQQGTHRDDCIFSTDATMAPDRIVSLFTRRWSIEVTFEEVRAHLGFETTRQRVAKSVLRMAPCLLGLFSVISLAFAAYNRRHRVHPATTPWYEKTDITFSDAIACVRRLLWEQTVFGTSRYAKQYAKLTPGLRNLLFDCLSPAG